MDQLYIGNKPLPAFYALDGVLIDLKTVYLQSVSQSALGQPQRFSVKSHLRAYKVIFVIFRFIYKHGRTLFNI